MIGSNALLSKESTSGDSIVVVISRAHWLADVVASTHTVVKVLACVSLFHELGKVPVMLVFPTLRTLTCQKAQCVDIILKGKQPSYMLIHSRHLQPTHSSCGHAADYMRGKLEIELQHPSH